MNGQHTQGPWTIGSEVGADPDSPEYRKNSTAGWPFFVSRPSKGLGDSGYHPAIGIQDIDDAYLIAAAPDLFAALQDCMPDLEHYASTHGPGPCRHRLAKAWAALTKAAQTTPA